MRRHALILGILTLALGGFGAPAPAAGAATVPVELCRNASAVPKASTLLQARRATICEINRIRAYFDLQPLAYDPRLREAAERHARDMARRDYFSHVSPGGTTLVDRVLRAGLGGDAATGESRVFGETLGWARGRAAAPRHIVVWWMVSPAHSAVLLDPRYRSIGVGIVRGAPNAGAGRAATYVANLAD